jgi:hypothetical protein
VKATRCAVFIVLLGSGVLSLACGRSRPVGNISVRPTTVNLAYPFVAPLSLRWIPITALDGLQGKPRVFVHVLDSGRRLLRTFDHPLREAWTPGREQSYEIELYQSAIAERLPAGAHDVTFGLYDDAGKTRWPLVVEGEEVGRREYRLATLVVPSSAAPSPTFQFSSAWLPIEPGPSKQVVARRCLRTEGSILVLSPPSPGRVRLAASLTAGGSASASVGWKVSASCTSKSVDVTGTDPQWIGFPMVPAATEPPCEIHFTPPAPAPADARSLCLEVLAWRPATP